MSYCKVGVQNMDKVSSEVYFCAKQLQGAVLLSSSASYLPVRQVSELPG